MTWPQWFVLMLLSLNFLMFIVASRLLFRADHVSKKTYAFVVFFFGLMSASIGSVFTNPTDSCTKLGIASALMAVSALLFGASVQATRKNPFTAIFSHDEPHHLKDHGPYAHVRHPFYTAYLLNYAGAAFASNGWVPYLVWGAIFGLYHAAARAEELKFMRSPLADSYRRYRATTGMFIPRYLARGNHHRTL